MNKLPFEIKVKVINDTINQVRKFKEDPYYFYQNPSKYIKENLKECKEYGSLPTLFCMYPNEFIESKVVFSILELTLCAYFGGYICPEFFIEYLHYSEDNKEKWYIPLLSYNYLNDEYKYIFGTLSKEFKKINNIKTLDFDIVYPSDNYIYLFGNISYTEFPLPTKSEMFNRLLKVREYNKSLI